MALLDELEALLARDFPGSTLDEGYWFVKIKAPHEGCVAGGRSQPIADDLCAGRAWLLVVGADPAPFVGTATETRRVQYQSDWNVNETMTMYGVALAGPVDLAAVGRSLRGPNALAIVAPDRGLILDVAMLRLHAVHQDALDRVVAAHPDCFAGP